MAHVNGIDPIKEREEQQEFQSFIDNGKRKKAEEELLTAGLSGRTNNAVAPNDKISLFSYNAAGKDSEVTHGGFQA